MTKRRKTCIAEIDACGAEIEAKIVWRHKNK